MYAAYVRSMTDLAGRTGWEVKVRWQAAVDLEPRWLFDQPSCMMSLHCCACRHREWRLATLAHGGCNLCAGPVAPQACTNCQHTLYVCHGVCTQAQLAIFTFEFRCWLVHTEHGFKLAVGQRTNHSCMHHYPDMALKCLLGEAVLRYLVDGSLPSLVSTHHSNTLHDMPRGQSACPVLWPSAAQLKLVRVLIGFSHHSYVATVNRRK